MVTAPPKPEDRTPAMADRILELAQTDWAGAQEYVRYLVRPVFRTVQGNLIVIFDHLGPRHEVHIAQVPQGIRTTAYDVWGRDSAEVLEFTPEFLADILSRVVEDGVLRSAGVSGSGD